MTLFLGPNVNVLKEYFTSCLIISLKKNLPTYLYDYILYVRLFVDNFFGISIKNLTKK